MQKILDITPNEYQRHFIHTQERDWAETNCYVDVWIELLHALGQDPIAAMPFSFGIDFEGDQWTFFKYQLADIYELYGIEVQELAAWKPLVTHIEEQVELGRPVLVELDSMYLPDTAGTAYKIAHVKTTVAVNEIDTKNKRMGYFHAQGYYYLEGDDFINVLRLGKSITSEVLPPYIEIAKLAKIQTRTPQDLLEVSLGIFRKQLAMLPIENPFYKFKEQLEKDLAWLKNEDIAMFHQYSFATLRQLGACYELSSNYIDWLIKNGETELEEAKRLFKQISETAKVYQFQLARVISRGKSLDITTIDNMANYWSTAMNLLKNKYLA
jgi:hypothetical protein